MYQLISRAWIDFAIIRLANYLDTLVTIPKIDYGGTIYLLGIAEAGIPFMRDISKSVHFPHETLTVKASYYDKTTNKPQEKCIIENPEVLGRLRNERVIVLDCVCETGMTLRTVVDSIASKNLCAMTLINKGCPEMLQTRFDPSIPSTVFSVHSALKVPKEVFLFGYGMDLSGEQRWCSSIYIENEV